MEATNRQKKFLTFFKIPFSPDLSTGAAGWEISEILQDEKCRDRWWRYKFLTQDFGSDSPHVKPFTEAELDAVVFPEGWDADKEGEKFEVELAAQIMADGAPFDVPQPPIQVEGRSLMFTGKFTFGTRNACHKAILDRGGIVPAHKTVTRALDYLVIGSGGSANWIRGSYGSKIEEAILLRREHGTPAIVSEDHWVNQPGLHA